ncbi:heme peroxidase [Mycena pura]|uniref:Heme peroxidase n=1 Tax=Mycena pura TaxID=153505 RepID=A0AAD6Y9M2_9AGAR|nr:heme peroxidase [Mycena pura]
MASITPIQAFSLGADAVYLSKRPLPTAPDGLYDWEDQANPNTSPQAHAGVTNLINEVRAPGSPYEFQRLRPHYNEKDAFIDQVLHPDAVDDRKGAFADGLGLISKLPPSTGLAKDLSNAAVTLLYNSMPHPRTALLGPVHSYRQADGGGNNLQTPDLGRAGMPYARTVQGKWCNALTSLPDPGLIFDTLLKASHRVDHPGGNSSLIFAFASIVTHSVFRTDFIDWNINNTSSYLDLSPLYGISQATQDLVRNKDQGRGLLYPDTFSEERLMFLPPAASVILVILNRNHNYIADMLLKINERGRWTDPPPTDEKARAQQDEEIFQTARLVNCGHFMGLIISDYVPSFLGLSEGGAWNINAFDSMKTRGGVEIGRGEGNHCSVEFNVLYRWHPTLSAPDQKWTECMFTEIFNKPFDQITMQDFGQALKQTFATINPDPRQRTIATRFIGLQRGPDGRFSDDDLADILHSATEAPAGAYRAQGTPEVLRVVEMMGILQARQWRVCTMNEFRKFMGLRQFKDFNEWNSDPEIADAARRLYGHIDNLELYTGLQCEDTMPLTPGSRFAAGYTMTRAILSDAINLVRGDRFFTTDFTPGNLTAWGYQDCLRDPHNMGFVSLCLPKLLMRHLPRHYSYNSVYGCFPFFTPQRMQTSLKKQGIAADYIFDRPVATRVPKVINTYTAIKHVCNDPARFPTIYDMSGLGNGYGFMLSFNTREKHDPDLALAVHALFPTKDALNEHAAWFRNTLSKFIKERSWKFKNVAGNYVDIVSVVNATFVHWATDLMLGFPLKTRTDPSGLYTEREVYDMLMTLFTLTFMSVGDNEHTGSLRWAAIQAGGVIQALVAKTVLEIAPGSAPTAVLRFIGKVSKFLFPQSDKPYYPFLSKLAETGRPLNELVALAVGLAGGSSVNFSQAAVHVIDFYFDETHTAERMKISQLVKTDDPRSMQLLCGYVREAMRLNPQCPGLWRDVMVDASIPQGGGLPDVEVKAGDRIWASLRNADLNPADFPNPTSVDPSRPASAYNLNGTGFHLCPGVALAVQTIAEVLKVVFKLKNVRRAPGNDGTMLGFKTIVNETETNVYLTPYGTTSPWPGSMNLVVRSIVSLSTCPHYCSITCERKYMIMKFA